MKNKIKHFLAGGLAAVCVVCIAAFAALAFYLNRQSDQAVTQLGSIYMANINDRISKHFGAISNQCLVPMTTFAENLPPTCENNKEAYYQWMTYYGHSREYESISWCDGEGNIETIYGDPLQYSGPATFLETLKNGEGRVAVGYNGAGEQVVLMCAPVSLDIPGMEDCVAMIGEMPISYLSEILSLDTLEDKSTLIYSLVIRKNGDFVVRNSAAVRDNYFDRVRAVYAEADGQTPENYIAELEAAMQAGSDYSTMVQVEGVRQHMYASSLPNSVWYLVTFMPYGALNKSVESLGTRSLSASAAVCAVILLSLIAVFLRYFTLNRAQMKELEEARQLAEEAKLAAEKASKSKGEFLSNMSHDIRTPMNAIVGMTAIATAHMDDPQQVQNCLKKITMSSRHLLGLINDVLDMSKIESGKMTLNEELVSLREIMESIVSIVQPQVKAKHQKFNISIFNILSENVHCDSVRLNQVLLNLLSNAIKFTPEGGSIEVSIYEEVSPKGEDYVRIRISVKDTGIGMSEEYQAHIFESFSREDNKRIHRTEGTGLGMAITKYIVDAMGGEITVDSQQGVGTQFQVVLDLQRAVEQVEDMILPDWVMLVVDDDQQLCESTVDSLRSIGIRAEWVLDGKDAVQMAAQHHKAHNDYHVILLDWKLPDMDGIQTARELRRQLGDDVPILLMSAYDWTEIEEEARAAGISGFLMKPLFRSTLFYGLKPYVGAEEVQAAQEEKAPEFSNRRILVAEDNELNWEIANELLHDLGLELEWAENGEVCTEMFRRSDPGYYDAILMDIRMPIMDGYQATVAIRAMDRPDASLPIIAMTADAYSDDIQRCLSHGMNAHVAKPIDIGEVARILKKHLND
ncbi:hybrid sensor histidine kinase/response regulator [uncultured Dysosmobacter sp.]|uniref:hybrid sensor histidine kinase/response regulator n=1 Tax=uncultured Dysosmobacter sp. TaxID=2591384 RepID=UPI0026134DB8|nr:response regulator [uncultured Dysosmobacter sp.]